MPKKQNNRKQPDRPIKGNEANPKKPEVRRPVEDLQDQNKAQKSVVPAIEVLTGDRKYSKRKLVSNWDRYVDPVDLPPDDSFADPYDENTDYTFLSCSKATGGQEFRLKSEKDWEDENLGKDLKSEPMRLDLKEIALAFNTIPLYRRFRLDSKYFPVQDVTSMEEEAEANKAHYFQLCQESPESEPQVSESIVQVATDEKTIETKKIVDKVIENHLTQQLSVVHKPVQKEEERGERQEENSNADFLDYLLKLEDTKEGIAESNNQLTIDDRTSNVNSFDDQAVDEWLDSIIND